VTQGHTLLDRSITDLERALATVDGSAKSRMAGTEKRLASQEAAMKERVVRLEVRCCFCSTASFYLVLSYQSERDNCRTVSSRWCPDFDVCSTFDQVKLGGLEENLRTKVASMEGSLASQEEQLKESVPIEVKLAQDAALEQKFSEVSDGLRAEVIAVKERLAEIESRMAAQEGELGNATAEIRQELGGLQDRTDAAARAQQAAQAEALRTTTEEVLQTVDHRNAGLRELIFQIHELLNAHHEEAAQSAEHVSQRIAAVEESIHSTDALLSEHVNAVQNELTLLFEHGQIYARAADVTSQLAEMKGNLAEETSAISSEVKTVSDQFALFEEDCSRRIAEVELKASANQASVKVKLVELEGRIDEQEGAVDAALSVAATAHQEELEKVLEQLQELQDQLASTSGELTETVQASETTLLGKIADSSQLMQMQEKRLRAVEKGIDSKHAETVSATADLRAFATDRMSALADGIAQHAASTKETVSALAMQLVGLQGQMNDHTDEVRSAIDSEISTMKMLISSEISDYSAATTGAVRVEEWVSDLQRAHDDHSERFSSVARQTEDRLQTLEGTIAGLQGILTNAQVAAPAVATAESATASAADIAAASTATHAAIDRVRSELATVETSTKQRLTSLEQRLVRQEAQSREKSAELAEALNRQSTGLDTRITSVEDRLDKVESEQSDVDRVLDRMDELGEAVDSRTQATDEKIQDVQASLTEQIRALQQTRAPVASSEMKKGPEGVTSASRPRTEPPSAHRPQPRAAASAPYPHDVRHSGGYTAQEMHDISRVSQISISPVNKRQDSLDIDIFEQRCELTLTEDYPTAEAGEDGNGYSYGGTEDGKDDYADFEEEDELVADLAQLSLTHSDRKGSQDRSRRQDKQEKAEPRGQTAHSQRQQERPHRYGKPASAAPHVHYAEEDEEDEEEGEDGGGALTEFNSMMETVNFDIVALGSHLKAFKPSAGEKSGSAPSVTAVLLVDCLS
jgi:DNA repair exonuclease SbcCD ATPase subunit